MAYRSYRVSSGKIRDIWDQATINQIELDKNNNFKPIDVQEVIKHSRKSITKIPIVVLGSNTWYGSLTLKNFTEEMIDYVYPLAVFKFIDPNVNMRDILNNGDTFEVFEGLLYYWFNKIDDSNYVLRFAIDGSLDTDEQWNLDFSLIFYNKRLYNNVQKTKK